MSYNYPTQHPLQPSDELFFQVSSIPFSTADPTIQQDTSFQVLPPPSNYSADLSIKSQTINIKSTNSTAHNDDAHGDGGRSGSNKKIIHRDIERVRRQEMNALYSSLRSLLPLEYLKGKRSISDHMNEAVHYIKHLEKKIQELGDKRDKLKRLSSSSKAPDQQHGNLCQSGPVIKVHPCWPGVEIIIGGNWRDGVLPLSRVLRVLVEEGFCLVSCVSTKVKESSIYTIQAEVMGDSASKNIALLEHKLMDSLQLQS